MKIRKGFVSNSSSSSFICDVCGETAEGWDLCLSEAEMCECENGHIFCEDHLIGEWPEDDEDGEFRYEIPADQCTICTMQVLKDTDGFKYLKKKFGTTDEEILKEIKETYSSYKDFSKDVN